MNVPLPVPMAFNQLWRLEAQPFGDHHAHGPEGVRFYTRHKAVMQRWSDAAGSRPESAFPSNL